MIPRICLEIPIAKYQGEHPEMNAEFAAARNQLLRKGNGALSHLPVGWAWAMNTPFQSASATAGMKRLPLASWSQP
jgi:hypothetical protein